MKANPLILNSLDDAGRRLARIEAQPHDPKNEAWLQELLHRHPELLPVDAFDDAFGPPISIGREVATERGPIDNLFVSIEGGLTVVETKLWKNPEKHRTVVAQIIDYAKELATWDYDGLCSAVLDSSRRQGETEKPSLEEKVARTLREQGIELHEFQENVARCLAEGNFLLLIVGDRISPNLALLTQAIQSAPGLGFTLGLVEMQLYKAEPGKEWPLIIVPEVMGRTVEKTRGIVRVRYDQEKPQVQVEVEGDDTTVKLDFDLFLKEIPQDLVQPFREAAEKWKQMGGILETPGRTIHFSTALRGELRRIIRCMTFQVQVVTRQAFESWSLDQSIYERYLSKLEASSVASNLAHSGKHWISYRNIGPDDLRVVLNAGMALVEWAKEAEDG